MSFQITVANQIHRPALEALEKSGRVTMNDRGEPWSRDELAAQSLNADALMVFMTEKIDGALLSQCPNLKIIAGALKGYNNIDVDACTKRNIIVTIVPDLLTDPTAELTLGLMISVARNFLPGDRHIRSGSFNGWRPTFYGGSIQGSTVAVLGAGAVGKAILRMLKGFDCRRLYVDTSPLDPEAERALDVERVTLGEAQGEADFIVLATHLMPQTLHMIDDAFLAGMKPGSFLINPARGSLVDEDAVVRALNSGHLAGYGADTFEMEDWTLDARPKAINPGLLQSDRTVLTPHIGSAVKSVREAIERSAAESIIAVLNGKVPDTAVNRHQLAKAG